MLQMALQNNSTGAVVIIMILGMLLMMTAGVLLTIFWIMMIIDCVKRKQLSDGERTAWILVLVFLGIIGAGIYYIAVKRK